MVTELDWLPQYTIYNIMHEILHTQRRGLYEVVVQVPSNLMSHSSIALDKDDTTETHSGDPGETICKIPVASFR